jgi:flagellar biosynthesis protein FlhF
MQIKRFEAKNMTEALRLIKRELGPEAVILSAKDLRRENRLLGITRKIGVEVTAAIDEDYPAGSVRRNGTDDLPGIRSGRGTAREMISPPSASRRFVDRINDVVRLKGRTVRGDTGTGAPQPSMAGIANAPAEAPPTRGDAPDTAAEGGNASMIRHLAKHGLSVGRLALDRNRINFIALVGNAGVGKTTTIAKLAAAYAYRDREAVGLLSLDRSRIGGIAQLQSYADSMNLPFVAPETKNDLQGAAERMKGCRVILVDTPAIHPHDTTRLAALKTQFDVLGSVKTLLAVSAEGREEDLNATDQRYAALNPVGVVITKTDLTRSYGDLVNYLCRRSVAVFFYSDGPRVTMDLNQATLEKLAVRFVQRASEATGDRIPAAAGGLAADLRQDDEPLVYLANKNSDIFHRPECKWIRLINRTHIVEFDSFAEALNHRFKPCRYCNPQNLSIAGLLSRESAAQ